MVDSSSSSPPTDPDPADDRETVDPVASRTHRQARIPGLTIVYHPDVARIGERATLEALRLGKPVALSRTTPLFAAPRGGPARSLDDPCISRRPVQLHPGRTAGELTIDPRDGVVHINGVPAKAPRALSDADLDRGIVLKLAGRAVLLLHWLDPAPPEADSLGLVGANRAIEELRRDIVRVADLDVSVLVRGETGSGKELIAQAIHRRSARADGPFVSINVAAIPPATAASELFGHARGAFTGATANHIGYFAQADGGTLFLDEIGATPPDVQAMLLRALESFEIQPLGSAAARHVDIRIIAATDAELEKAIDEGSFRAAVYHRLEGYQLFVPPLRQRRDDIGRLLIHFVRTELEGIGELSRLAPPGAGNPWLPADLVDRLARFDWPGNVRQLRNVVRQLTISSRGLSTVRIDAALEQLLDDAGGTAESQGVATTVAAAGGPITLSDDQILTALRAHDFHVPAVADALGVSRSALYGRIKASDRIRQAKDLNACDIAAAREACGEDIAGMARQLDVSARALALRMKALGLHEG